MQGKEKALQAERNTRQSQKQVKDSHKKAQLKKYLSGLPFHPPVIEHYSIAKSFGVLHFRQIFREDADRRFISSIFSEPRTAATVSKLTGITHKFLCQRKRSLEESGVIKVLYLDRCATTGSSNVQHLSSNPDHWDDHEFNNPQTKLEL